ncbi:LysR family transcriptional regulator [Sporolactobacillus nakayamae]|uniref:DNA-binding transcriptional regulator, LysR family n=1 Tax=Sporolactobacillus nakayamae TaxID=269670 RepID=A0A1I2VJJ1_9BACL|nr:LysR family transcriptional regulator [Sporolactobacillus nakayamae]SFG89342.1 DNA-binding transcriptional regulator, LysR family [Sporolactobacillus nakayamae]
MTNVTLYYTKVKNAGTIEFRNTHIPNTYSAGAAKTDIKHLHYFLEVAVRKSFTKAAHHLYVTQPTISKMVRDIEDELGMVLLDRTGKEIELTDAGRIVFEQSQKIVQSFAHLSDELSDLTHAKKGKLTVGLPPMIGMQFFPGILSQFRKSFPGIDLHSAEYGAKKVADCVSDGLLEVGVTVGSINEEVLNSFVFFEDSIRLVVHTSSPLAKLSHVTLTDLRDEHFILFPEDFSLRGMIINGCEKAGYQPNIVFESSQWEFMVKMVSKGFGIAFLPESVISKMEQKAEPIITLPIEESELNWRLSMIWKKNHYLSYAARTWVSETRAMLMGIQ